MINNLKAEERRLIIKNLEANKIIYKCYYSGPQTTYAFTNDCWKIPLDKNGKQKKEEAIDISNNEQLINELRQDHYDKLERLKWADEEAIEHLKEQMRCPILD